MVGHCVFSYRALYRALFGHWSGTDRALCFPTVFVALARKMLQTLGFPKVFYKRGLFVGFGACSLLYIDIQNIGWRTLRRICLRS